MIKKILYSNIYCACGCGEFPKQGNSYINGHNQRGNKKIFTEKHKQNMSLSAKNRGKIKETILCKCGCGEYTLSGNKYINGHYWRNRKRGLMSEGVRYKISNSKKGQKPWIEGKHHKKESIKRMSESNKGKHTSIETEFKKGKHISIETEFKKGYIQPKEWGIRRSEKMSGDSHWNWQNGKSFEIYPIEFNKKFKQLIYERDNYQCQYPNCTEIHKKLNAHHIDYDKQNNNPENIITLGTSCHMKTNFNRQYWTEFYQNIMMNKLIECLL